MIRPLSGSVLLSGNFGELRATHFHSGIDLRTGGVEGLPVRCVKDGILARVRISPVGYGQALYIEHEDGTTTVYGHLQRFCFPVNQIVRELQYQKESFGLDEDMKAHRLFFRQGDTIAYSGNTGSSGGPHLHFEVRNTVTEHTLNPLHDIPIRDLIAPKVRNIYVYRITDYGGVEVLREVSVKQLQTGRYTAGNVNVPVGSVGIGVHAEDYMNDSWNKLGIYALNMIVGTDTLFRMKVDSCSFEQSCFINEIKDFYGYKKRQTVYRCFGNYQNQVLGVWNSNKGVFRVEQDSVVTVRMTLADFNGNRSEVSLQLKGKAEEKAEVIPEERLLRYDRAYRLEFPGGHLEMEAGTLFYTVPWEITILRDSVSGKEIYRLSQKEIPLLKKARLYLQGEYEKDEVICEVDAQGRKYALATAHEEQGIAASIGYLSRYMVVRDSLAPTITYLGKLPDRTLKFKIKDELSGIASYRGEVNGKWCLFVYDAKNDLYWCSLKEPVFEKGKPNLVRIKVADRAGHESSVKVEVKI